MIACLGWGSLIWDRRKLAVEGQWQTDGPKLPVEFTRVSGGKRLTLVITDGAVPVTVLWSQMTVASLDDGIKNLSEREGARRAAIAFWSPDRSSGHDEASIVGEWAAARDFSSVIWTGLKPGFPGNRGEPLTHQQALDHLRGLEDDNRKNAEEYVRRAPDQVKTVYRTALRDPKLRDEALDLLRSLIDQVEIRPAENGFEIELVGDIAHMVEFANSQGHTKKRASLDGAVRCSVKVVAGARNHLNLLFDAPGLR